MCTCIITGFYLYCFPCLLLLLLLHLPFSILSSLSLSSTSFHSTPYVFVMRPFWLKAWPLHRLTHFLVIFVSVRADSLFLWGSALSTRQWVTCARWICLLGCGVADSLPPWLWLRNHGRCDSLRREGWICLPRSLLGRRTTVLRRFGVGQVGEGYGSEIRCGGELTS